MGQSKYPDELRDYVWQRYCAGTGTREIFAGVMKLWPDCGMKTFRSVCMMLGPLSVERGGVKPQRAGHHRMAPRSQPLPPPEPKKPDVSLGGPSWSHEWP